MSRLGEIFPVMVLLGRKLLLEKGLLLWFVPLDQSHLGGTGAGIKLKQEGIVGGNGRSAADAGRVKGRRRAGHVAPVLCRRRGLSGRLAFASLDDSRYLTAGKHLSQPLGIIGCVRSARSNIKEEAHA